MPECQSTISSGHSFSFFLPVPLYTPPYQLVVTIYSIASPTLYTIYSYSPYYSISTFYACAILFDIDIIIYLHTIFTENLHSKYNFFDNYIIYRLYITNRVKLQHLYTAVMYKGSYISLFLLHLLHTIFTLSSHKKAFPTNIFLPNRQPLYIRV